MTHDNISCTDFCVFLAPRFGKRYVTILGGLGAGHEGVSKLLRSHCTWYLLLLFRPLNWHRR